MKTLKLFLIGCVLFYGLSIEPQQVMGPDDASIGSLTHVDLDWFSRFLPPIARSKRRSAASRRRARDQSSTESRWTCAELVWWPIRLPWRLALKVLLILQESEQLLMCPIIRTVRRMATCQRCADDESSTGCRWTCSELAVWPLWLTRQLVQWAAGKLQLQINDFQTIVIDVSRTVSSADKADPPTPGTPEVGSMDCTEVSVPESSFKVEVEAPDVATSGACKCECRHNEVVNAGSEENAECRLRNGLPRVHSDAQMNVDRLWDEVAEPKMVDTDSDDSSESFDWGFYLCHCELGCNLSLTQDDLDNGHANCVSCRGPEGCRCDCQYCAAAPAARLLKMQTASSSERAIKELPSRWTDSCGSQTSAEMVIRIGDNSETSRNESCDYCSDRAALAGVDQIHVSKVQMAEYNLVSAGLK